jgi:hypothetical protein
MEDIRLKRFYIGQIPLKETAGIRGFAWVSHFFEKGD